MMNLWAFLFLGFLAQTSNACVQQKSFSIMEKMLDDAVTDIIMKLRGRNLPDIEVEPASLLYSGVTARSVTVTNVTPTSVHSKCSSAGKVSITASATFTVGSDAFSDAVFNFALYMEITTSIKNGHYHCIWEPEPFSLSVELSNSFSCIKCTPLMNENEVKKSFVQKCQLLLKGIAEGSIHTAMTFMNRQHVRLTEKFKYKDFFYHYEVDHYELYEKSLVTYMTLYCDNKGPLNDAKPFALNVMKPGEDVILYMDKKLLDSLLAAVKLNYTKPIKEAETNGAFPQGTGDMLLSFTSNSPPESSITTEGATSRISLTGIIKDSALSERLHFEPVFFVDNLFTIIGGNMKQSLRETTFSSLTTNDATKNDTLKRLEPLILQHGRQYAKEMSYELGVLKVPDPAGVEPKDATCSTQNEKVYCVQEKSKS